MNGLQLYLEWPGEEYITPDLSKRNAVVESCSLGNGLVEQAFCLLHLAVGPPSQSLEMSQGSEKTRASLLLLAGLQPRPPFTHPALSPKRQSCLARTRRLPGPLFPQGAWPWEATEGMERRLRPESSFPGAVPSLHRSVIPSLHPQASGVRNSALRIPHTLPRTLPNFIRLPSLDSLSFLFLVQVGFVCGAQIMAISAPIDCTSSVGPSLHLRDLASFLQQRGESRQVRGAHL